jgi:hypothetical protein
LVGQEIVTLTNRMPNRVLRVENEDVVVGTQKSPRGRPVPIQWVQDGSVRLAREGAVEVTVEDLGHRGRSSVLCLRRSPVSSYMRRRRTD